MTNKSARFNYVTLELRGYKTVARITWQGINNNKSHNWGKPLARKPTNLTSANLSKLNQKYNIACLPSAGPKLCSKSPTSILLENEITLLQVPRVPKVFLHPPRKQGGGCRKSWTSEHFEQGEDFSLGRWAKPWLQRGTYYTMASFPVNNSILKPETLSEKSHAVAFRTLLTVIDKGNYFNDNLWCLLCFEVC